jgi:hypothetical protein
MLLWVTTHCFLVSGYCNERGGSTFLPNAGSHLLRRYRNPEDHSVNLSHHANRQFQIVDLVRVCDILIC